MKTLKTLDERLQLLNPDECTISEYVSMEKLSLSRITDMLKGNIGDKNAVDIGNLLHKFLTAANKIRTLLKGEVSMHVKLFHDVSKDKNELKAYIKATYPKMLKK